MARPPKPWYRRDRDCWYVTIAGKRHNLGPDREAAFRAFHGLMARPDSRPEPIVAQDALVGIVDAFLDWLHRNRSPATYEWYRYRLQRFVERWPDLRVDQLRPFHVQQWVDGHDFSVTSRRNYLRSAKRCLKWALQQGYVETDPIAGLEVPSAERREALVTSEEFETLLSYVRDESFRDLVVVTWETGCRPQESLRLEARHVDLEHGRWVFPKSESKAKRTSRVVYLTDKAVAVTRERLERFPSGHVFRNGSGRPWTTSAVNCAFSRVRERIGKQLMKSSGESISEREIKRFAKTLARTKTAKGKSRKKSEAELRCEAKAKLTRRRALQLTPPVSLYALRHSWATHALRRGVDPLTVAILMGHQDPSMLAKVYQHLALDPEHLRAQVRKAAG